MKKSKNIGFMLLLLKETKNLARLLALFLLLFVCRAEAQTESVKLTTLSTSPWKGPTGVSKALVYCWGGGGRCYNGITGYQSGGGGGAFAGGLITVSRTMLFVVGGQSSNSTFNTGVTDNELKAAGGSNGKSTTGGAGGSSTNCIGTVKWSGGDGGNFYGRTMSGAAASGGGGAGSSGNGGNGNGSSNVILGGKGGLYGGGNGAFIDGNSNVTAAQIPGGGGAAFYNMYTVGANSSNGAAGQIVIYYPTITTLSASSGCGAATLTITGTNLTGAIASGVTIGGVAVSSITSNSGTVMVVVPTTGSSGTVSVTSTYGTFADATYSYTVNSNPTSGGTIAAAQSGSTGFNPDAFTSSAAASGHVGTLEYKWQSSNTSSSSGFSDIASSDADTYDAAALTQTTWFKRLARVSCAADWSGAVESNVLEITVKATPSITTAPTASSILYGQTLASSSLSDGVASVAGTFAFTTPSTTPDAGTASQGYTFTPTDIANYTTITGTVSVKVIATTPPTAAAQTFCGSKTVADLAAIGTDLKWYADATHGSELATTTALVSGTYYVSQTLSGSESSRTSVVITVNTTSAPTASAQTFCNVGTVADLVVTGTDLKWYTDAIVGTALATSTALASGTYYISQTLNSCESSRASVVVTVNVTSAPTAVPQTFCTSGTVADLVATGTDLKWYAEGTNGMVLATSTALASGNYYVSQSLNSCESGITPVVVTVNVTSAPTAVPQTFCTSGTVADLVASGTDLKWYADATDGTALATSTILTSGTYYVSQTLNSCESSRTSVVVTVNTTSAPTASAQAFCTSGTVADLVASGTDLKWYADATDGTALATSTTLASGSYYVSQTLNSCESSRTSVVVTVNATSAPTASAQTFCSSGTVAELVATGTDLKWYSEDGTALATSTTIASGIYYVSQTLNSCESSQSSVVVTVNTTSAPTASAQTFCNVGTVADLVATGTDLKWYADATDGTALETTTVLAKGTFTYYVSQTLNTCESARTAVSVTVNYPVAGTISAHQIILYGSKPDTISLTGSVGAVQWESSIDNITFNTIIGATDTSLTSDQIGTLKTDQIGALTSRVYFRAQVSSADCPSVPSAFVRVYVIPLTKVQASQREKTLASLNTAVYANGVSWVTNYRFKVETTTGTETIESVNRYFKLTSLTAGVLYNTSYTISVATKYNGVWGEYGDQSYVLTPTSPLKVRDSQSGTTLGTLKSTIYSTGLTGASSYRFEVSVGNDIYTYDSANYYFNLSQLDAPIRYESTYAIRVSAYSYNNWQPYGASRIIYTPKSPLKVKDSQCGTTLSGLNSRIYSTGLTGASSYRFEVSVGNDIYTYDSANYYFNLSQLDAPIRYESTYAIRVAAKLYNTWQPYGASCTVSTPLYPQTKLQSSQCGITLSKNNTNLLYANAVSVAEMYRFEVSLGNSVYTYDTPSNAVRSFKLTSVAGLSLASGTSYKIRVAIKANGQWQPYGTSCTVTTYGTPVSNTSRIVTSDKNTEEGLTVRAIPNPFSANFNLSLRSSSKESGQVQVYDMIGRLIETAAINPSEVSTLEIGANYPSGVYNVIVTQGMEVKTVRVIKR